jgi:cyclophilin family peptidyl-prolyl cis-trans isomerase
MKKIVFLTYLILSSTFSFAQKKGKDYVVKIKTEFGEMVAILYDETPKHKANFIKLTQEHYYDSLLFHRIIEGFMIQGGDPDSKNAKPDQHLGNGGPRYTIDAEILPKYFHEKGALAAARLGDQQNPTKASSGSQFYIVDGTTYSAEELRLDDSKLNATMPKYLQDPKNKQVYDSLMAFARANDMKGYRSYLGKIQPRVEKATGTSLSKEIKPERLQPYTTIGGAPHLDDNYTVFGKVIRGLEVIDKIAAQPTGEAHRPVKDIRMRVSVEEMSKKKIAKEYGYRYPEEKK